MVMCEQILVEILLISEAEYEITRCRELPKQMRGQKMHVTLINFNQLSWHSNWNVHKSVGFNSHTSGTETLGSVWKGKALLEISLKMIGRVLLFLIRAIQISSLPAGSDAVLPVGARDVAL